MPLLLDKLLTQFALPPGSALVLAVLALVCLGLGRRTIAALCLLLSILWLWTFSTPLVAETLTRRIAADDLPVAAETLPQADLIVVLGGGLAPPDASLPYPDLSDAADRVWHAARLYHAGRAPRILVSGGNVWPDGEPAADRVRASEAAAMRRFLLDLGVPADAILLEGNSRTTRENAIDTAAILRREGLKQVLLVTSALHMPRALAAFRTAGVDAIPASTDLAPHSDAPRVLQLMPDSDALNQSARALKELLGLWIYQLRGWA